MPARFSHPEEVMRRAFELARRGEGRVEPNPMVGAVIVDSEFQLVGEGWHETFGGLHAEPNALRQAVTKARGATLYVTLEPCCHHGKTPPCVDAIIAAGITHVVVACQDPAPHADGRGIAALRAAKIQVEVGLLADEAMRLMAPFRKLVTTGRPYVHAKWAMSLDGKIATRTGDSKWISNERSRERTHQLRGRMDAIIVGSKTASADDPLLTTRPPGPRTPVRIVIDSQATLSGNSRLIQSVKEAPLLIAATSHAKDSDIKRLARAGAEVVQFPSAATSGPSRVDLAAVLDELGRRQMTNVLIEGGSQLLGAMLDAQLVDEAHVFVAPKIIGGAIAVPAVSGLGFETVAQAPRLEDAQIEVLDGDVYIRGPLKYAP